ncbi:hypothetical protein C8R45DRAFT_1165645, partial [Mycena sanguinolenta]
QLILWNPSDTVWRGRLDECQVRKSPDNLQAVDDFIIRDASTGDTVSLCRDVPSIINHIARNHSRIAIVSSNRNKALCDRALWYFKSFDPVTGRPKPIIEFVQYDEVYAGDKTQHFQRIGAWSDIQYTDMVNSSATSPRKSVAQSRCIRQPCTQPLTASASGSSAGVWQQRLFSALFSPTSEPSSAPGGQQLRMISWNPMDHKPAFGHQLGSGKFGDVYEVKGSEGTVVKRFRDWDLRFLERFLRVYEVVEAGGEDYSLLQPIEQDTLRTLQLWAFEFRNLRAISQLQGPSNPKGFRGWLAMTRVPGKPLWTTLVYQQYVFDITKHFDPVQRPTHLKHSFHLIVDEIEHMVQKYGIEHRDPHLANVMFLMRNDLPGRAYLFDWGIAARMTWDDGHYVRGRDTLLWTEQEQGVSYTPREFREYWIYWMIKTEYEAYVGRGAIRQQDANSVLQDISWWLRR